MSEYVGVVTGEAVLGANVFRDQEEQQAPDGEPERADRQPGEDSAAYLVTA